MTQTQEKSFHSDIRSLRWHHWAFSALLTAAVLLSVRSVFLVVYGQSDLRLSRPLLMSVILLLAWVRLVLPMFRKHIVMRLDATNIVELNTATFQIEEPVSYSKLKKGLRRSKFAMELTFHEPVKAYFTMGFINYYCKREKFLLLADSAELDLIEQELRNHRIEVEKGIFGEDDPVKQYTLVALIIIGIFLFTFLVDFLLKS